MEHQGHGQERLTRTTAYGALSRVGSVSCLRVGAAVVFDSASNPADLAARGLAGVVSDRWGYYPSVAMDLVLPKWKPWPKPQGAPFSWGLSLSKISRQHLLGEDCFKLNYSVACNDGLLSPNSRTSLGHSSEPRSGRPPIHPESQPPEHIRLSFLHNSRGYVAPARGPHSSLLSTRDNLGCGFKHGPVHPIFRRSQALRSIEHPRLITDKRSVHEPAFRQRAGMSDTLTPSVAFTGPPVNFRWQATMGTEAVESLSAG